MKKLILAAFVFTSFMITGCMMTGGTMTTISIVHHPNPTFRDLDNYGTWVNIPDYGTVWKPYDEVNWQPYADGQWVWTDQGWMWDANEPYGWIVYHYGYWQFTDYDGWFWIPGYDWAPARVDWYRSDGYVGWAPAPPPTVGQTFIYNDRYVSKVWVIVPEQNFAGQNAEKYRNRSHIPGAQVLRSNGGGRAPDVRDIEQVSHRRIDVVRPDREQVNAGNRQLTRVRMQNNTPVRPSTIRNQPEPVRTPNTPPPTVSPQKPDRNPPTHSPDINHQMPVRTPTTNPPVVIPPKPVSKPPEINDRRPVNNAVHKQPEERNNPIRQMDNSGNTQKGKAQDIRANTNQKKSGRNDSARNRDGANKKPTNIPAPVSAPVRSSAPAKDKSNDTTNKGDSRGRAKEIK